MKVVFTGGGTGGHFYPIIAIAEAIRDLANENQFLDPSMYFIADKPYDAESLFATNIVFLKCPAGKMRRYFSFQNFTDIFVTLHGIVVAFLLLLKILPDVVVSKGGYASVPTVIAAKWIGIPIIVHESDAKPGRANLLGAKRATRIAVAFESAIPFFPAHLRSRIARVGIPVRKELASVGGPESKAELGLDVSLPTVLIFGGSSGSMRINEVVLTALPELTAFGNVIHQTGKEHFEDVGQTAKVILENDPNRAHYHSYPYLNAETIRKAAGAADVVVSRAGSTAITEIALWGKPAILIPIPENVSHDQRANAYAYARTGAAVVLEEGNLTPHVLASEVRRIGGDMQVASEMSAHASGFANPNAARIIAEEVARIASSHQKK